MVFGMNGGGTNGGAEGARQLIQSAANSATFAVVARLAIITLGVLATVGTGVVLPRALTWFDNRETIDRQQNEFLQQLSTTQQLIVYRLGQVEDVNREQEEHFRASDGRINRLERVVPEPMRPGQQQDWPSKELFR